MIETSRRAVELSDPDTYMNAPLDSTYSDETSTGGRSDAFRGIGRATVAARVEDLDGFDWLLALKRDHFPDKLELKAPLVIEVMATRPIVQKQVLDHVSSATIIIVDLGEHYRRLLTRVCEMTGNPPLAHGEAIRHALERTLPREFIQDYLLALRGAIMLSTPIPKIETILRDILQETGSGVVDRGLLVDRDDLQAMKDPEFREFVARFSAAFADALAPDRQAEAILAGQSMGRLLTPAYLGSVTLGETVSVDRYTLIKVLPIHSKDSCVLTIVSWAP